HVPGDGPRRRRRVARPDGGEATEVRDRGAAARRCRPARRAHPGRGEPDAAAILGQGKALWPARIARRLADRYGREAPEVMSLGRELDLVAPLGEGVD